MDHFKTWVNISRDAEGYKPQLIEKVKESLKKNDKDELKECIYTITEYKLHASIDMLKTCESLAINNQLDFL